MMERLVSSIGGIAGFGVLSICLFFLVFTGALICTLCHKKSFLNAMESLPLQDDDSRADKKGEVHHV